MATLEEIREAVLRTLELRCSFLRPAQLGIGVHATATVAGATR